MKDILKKFADGTFWRFILVGIANTVVGTAVMFLFYNFFHLSYWISTAANYIVGSILSYFLNKNFTFRNKSRSIITIVKFTINILCCYFVAYGLARPFIRYLLAGYSTTIQDNMAMLIGMGLFIILNYFGQRFWAFKE